MGLAQLVRTVGTDPALADASTPRAPAPAASLDLSAPAGLRPFVAALLAADPDDGGAGRTGAAGDRGRPRGERARDRAVRAAAGRIGRGVPAVGDAAARAALAAVGHRRPAARGAAPARPPRPRRAGRRPAPGRGRPGARAAAADGRRARRPRAGRAAGRRRDRARRPGRAAGRGRVRAGRHGRAARRVRGARRDRRRVPADRGPPAAGRALGRHGRGDPLVRGRRPAQPRPGARRGCGRRRAASSPHRRGPRARAGRWSPQHPELADMLDKLAEGIAVEGMEALAPVLVDGMELLVDVVPAGTVVAGERPGAGPQPRRRPVRDQPGVPRRVVGGRGRRRRRAGRPRAPPRTARSPTSATPRSTAGCAWWGISPFAVDEELDRLDRVDRPTRRRPRPADCDAGGRSTEPPAYRGDTDRAIADVRGWLADRLAGRAGHRGPRPGAAPGRGARGADVPARFVEDGRRPTGDARRRSRSSTGVPRPPASSRPGCELAVLAEADLLGRAGASTRDERKMPSRRRNVVDPLQLRPGDYVVHEQHGVGAYVEMVQRTVQGATREYLVIEYASSKRGQPRDRLYVPTDSLDQVTRYVGGEQPTLHKLGGSDWAKAKGRARKAVREIAAELIKLYSARMAAPGFAFSPDTPWQRELEDAFPYVETPDQLETIDEVKADMERPVPMDRLICGDVGYGKTEIAVRAAFKAVQDGKQVAVLVPTTLLVQQHLGTFAERYAPFPVKVAALSRFQTDAEAAEVQRADHRGHGRRRDRHAPADPERHAVQGPRPGRRRRGAALRRRAQGVPQAPAHQRRRAEHVRDADPAHARDGGHRHPRDVDDPDPARGAPPGADVRRRVRREADLRGDPARAAARRPGVLRPQPGAVDRQGGGQDPRARARRRGSRSRTGR